MSKQIEVNGKTYEISDNGAGEVVEIKKNGTRKSLMPGGKAWWAVQRAAKEN